MIEAFRDVAFDEPFCSLMFMLDFVERRMAPTFRPETM